MNNEKHSPIEPEGLPEQKDEGKQLPEDELANRIFDLHTKDRPFSRSLIIAAMKEFASTWVEQLEAPDQASKEQENDAVGFADWMDEKQKSRQLVRLKDNKIKWFYNHKPEAKEGKQQWIHYTTEQLYQLYKSNHEK